jgi:hypothetical protein
MKFMSGVLRGEAPALALFSALASPETGQLRRWLSQRENRAELIALVGLLIAALSWLTPMLGDEPDTVCPDQVERIIERVISELERHDSGLPPEQPRPSAKGQIE